MFERLRSAISGPAPISEVVADSAVEIIESPSLHDRLQHTRPEQQAGYQAGENHGGDPGAAADLAHWAPMTQSADLDIQQAGDTALARVIDLSQNSAHEAGAMQQHVAAIVGPDGLKLSARPDWHAIPGASEEWAREFAATLESEWRSFVRSDRNSVDRRRLLNWSAVNATLTQTLLQHGEILLSFEPRRSPLTGEMQTAIRIIDPSRLSNPKDNPAVLKERDIRQGVEYSSDGEPTAYWISTRHPRDVAKTKGRGITHREKMTWTRHAKWGRNGLQRIFHAIDPQRAGQSRGISPLVASLRAARMLKRTEDATLQAAVLQSIMALVVKSNANWKDIVEALGPTASDPQADGVSDFLAKMQKFQAGRGAFYAMNQPKIAGHNAKTIHLLPDEELQMQAAQAGNVEIANFLKEMRGGVASNHGLGLAEYSGDFSKVSFSAAKVSGALSARIQSGRRNRVIAPACQWIYGLFVEELLIRRPDLLPNKASFHNSRTAILRSAWTGPPLIEPDPLKAAKAADQRISTGYSSLEREAALIGEDWEESLQQRARELRLKDELGLFELEAKDSASKTAHISVEAGDMDLDDDGSQTDAQRSAKED